MGTQNNPGPFDCYVKAEPDEPMFILLARDASAAATVRAWCVYRINTGKNVNTDPQIIEAMECAKAMEQWREAHGKA